MHAWVTSVVTEDQVDRAIVLAGSLRRARTAMKIVAITTTKISKMNRKMLKATYDSVEMLHEDDWIETGDPALQSLLHMFSLVIFEKCVYMSPTMMVMKNCDTVFDKHKLFVNPDKTNGRGLNPHFFICRPNLELEAELTRTLLSTGGDWETRFTQGISTMNDLIAEPNFQHSKSLSPCQTMEFFFEGNNSMNPSIVHFVSNHPAEMRKAGCDLQKSLPSFNYVEQLALSHGWSILMEDIVGMGNGGSLLGSKLKSSSHQTEPIAIVGMSFRLPDCTTPEQFWALLDEGRDVIRRVPQHRWTRQHSRVQPDPEAQAGFLNCPIDEFDAKFFEIGPKEAAMMDPQQRLLLEVSWEALEDAGLDLASLHGTQMGVFVGSWMYNYRDLANCSPDFDVFRTYMGNAIATSSARLSHFIGCTGPSIATESGCSSSVVALDMAVKSLRGRECSAALACGVNLLIHPFYQKTIQGVLSPDYRCKTFDASANGFVRSEGVATLVLKRRSDALKDEDKIWGLIRGSAVVQEGVSRSMGTPTVHCEALAMSLALEDAGVAGGDVSFIEAHGTGTAVGDPMEIAAIAQAYKSPVRREPLLIGSVKTNVGHTESVCALTGIIKVLLSLQHEKIPRHRHLSKLNPEIDLEAIPAEIPLVAKPWPRDFAKRRIAGVSSFGISGTDGHVIIEEPPLPPLPQSPSDLERPMHILKLSAKCSQSLDELVNRYEALLSNEVDGKGNFPDVCFSANTGRSNLAHRAVIIAGDGQEAASILKNKAFNKAEIVSGTASIGFLFTGQGSQYHGMASQLYDTSPLFRLHFDIVSKMLHDKFGISIKNLLWDDEPNDRNALNKTLYSQTSIFCVEYCLLKLWESWGVTPDYVLGHSLGEYVAAVAVGILTLEGALTLVAERSRLIDSLPVGKMLVIKANKDVVDQTIANYKSSNPQFWVDYAALNSQEQTVLAGDPEMIQDFARFCNGTGLKTVVLASTHAFHSRLMNPILEKFREIASSIPYSTTERRARPHYVSGLEGQLVELEQIDANYWVRHAREKVNFIEACRSLEAQGCKLLLEIGPHPVLSVLANANSHESTTHGPACLHSLRRNVSDWAVLLESLGKLNLSNWKGSIDWKGFDMGYPRSRLSLPFYPFRRKPYWLKFRQEQPLLHPFVGRIIPNLSSNTIYENEFHLKNFSYVKEHLIGNTIVFPAAGFLEMCLAAGYVSIQGLRSWGLAKPRRLIGLRDLQILSPLALQPSHYPLIQTIVSCNEEEAGGGNNGDEEDGYRVKIAQQREEEVTGGREWLLHAISTIYTTSKTCSSSSVVLPEGVDLKLMQQAWELVDNAEFYQGLVDHGFRLGTAFKRLQRSWKGDQQLLMKIETPEDTLASYIIHPVVGDAMLQVLVMWKCEFTDWIRKLRVPVQVGNFVWYGCFKDTAERYAYCFTNGEGTLVCQLLNDSGQPLASMWNVEFLQTTVKRLENSIQQQLVGLPTVWKETYRSSSAPLRSSSLDMRALQFFFDEEFNRKAIQLSLVSQKEQVFCENLRSLTRYYVLRALFACGWKPSIGLPFSTDDLLHKLSLQKQFKNFIHFFLCSISQSRILRTDDETSVFWFTKEPPTSEEIRSQLETIHEPDELLREDYRLISEIGNKLHRILAGTTTPLSVLFPEDKDKPSVSHFYDCMFSKLSAGISFVNQALLPGVRQAMANAEMLSKGSSKNKSVFRILEIGAGTGSFTKLLLKCVSANEIPMEYHYTDISPAFFSQAGKELADYGGAIQFKRFDMEEDPLEQGFCPSYFDMVLACEVLHLSKDFEKTLRRVRVLLKSGGILQIVETIQRDPRNTFIFGLLDGYSRLDNLGFGNTGCSVVETWKIALGAANFDKVHCWNGYMDVHAILVCTAAEPDRNVMVELRPPRHSWILFDDGTSNTIELSRMLETLNRKVFLVRPPAEGRRLMEEEFKNLLTKLTERSVADGRALEGVIYLWGLTGGTDLAHISLPFVTLCQVLAGQINPPSKVFVVTRGIFPTDGCQVENPFPGVLVGLVRSVSNELLHIKFIHLDLSPQAERDAQVDKIFHSIWGEQLLPSVFREDKILSPKVMESKVKDEYLQLPHGCDRFQLVLPSSKLVSDMEFTYLDPLPVPDGMVEVEVKAMALNFRDILAVLKPTTEFENVNAVGLDFGGIVSTLGRNVSGWSVGDRVIGLHMEANEALPSHVLKRQDHLVPLPDSITFSEGVTIPAVFFTVYHCLVTVAKVKRGETILIHTASGGVGLFAIQLARRAGLNIIATAGSPRKRTFLGQNLGIQHVFNSRTTGFGEQILKTTGGGGVDIVLNSLTGPGFKEESLRALGQNGRFIEMSKLNIWKVEDVKGLRPDVLYRVVDVSSLDDETVLKLVKRTFEYMTSGLIQPIPYERFDALNIRGALNYMQKAKHIGKIVCVMPELKSEGKGYHKLTPMFNEASTYLVTGGLGGIGFEVVKWILRSGGKHVAIASRSSPQPLLQQQIDSWNSSGTHVKAFQVDVGNFDDCQRLFDNLRRTEELGFPPLRGIMHAAGVLADATIENQSWENFLSCYNPKVAGSWNLHQLSRNLLLEHFVLFSSFGSIFGSPGQTNHCSSNSFEDAFAHYRRSLGLPATSVNWGNWGEVGIATEIDFPGVTPISNSQGILALEVFLRTQRAHAAVWNVESFAMLSKAFPTIRDIIDDKKLFGEDASALVVHSDEFWASVDDNARDKEGRVEIFKNLIKSSVNIVLSSVKEEVIDDNADFASLGVDSLMMLELKNGLQSVLGARMTLTATQIKDCNTTHILACRMVDILDESLVEEDMSPLRLPNMEELIELMKEDSVLPEHITWSNSADLQVTPIEEVGCVLITGATGNLGPYLLKELCRRPQISKVYCLIRQLGTSPVEDRLRSALEAKCLRNDVELTKVECIKGDLTEPLLGLSKADYQLLATDVDAVIHSAVMMDHTAKYFKTNPSAKFNTRNVNVLGTCRLLEFSADVRPKHIYYASTISAVTSVDDRGSLSEDWPINTDYGEVVFNLGYSISKHVCEMLMKQAVERGAPCKTFRFPFFGGHSESGRVDIKSSHLLLRCLTAFKLGCIADIPYPLPCIPVDQCASLSLAVFFAKEAKPDVYSINQQHPVLEQDMIVAARNAFGIEVELVDFSTFLAKIQAESDSSPLAPFKALYEEEGFKRSMESPTMKILLKYVENPDNFFKSEKVAKILPEYYQLLESSHVCFQRDLGYLKRSGVFQKFGIQTK